MLVSVSWFLPYLFKSTVGQHEHMTTDLYGIIGITLWKDAHENTDGPFSSFLFLGRSRTKYLNDKWSR